MTCIEASADNRTDALAEDYYTIMEVKEVEGFKLLHIRNPFGGFEWDGDWGYESEMWDDYPEV